MKAETASIGVGERVRPGVAGEACKGARRALVVDDNDSVREILRRLLVAEGFECDTAVSGGEAFAQLESSARAGTIYDIIFVDIIMPGIDGLELARLIRARDERVAIVVVTGVADSSRAREALRLGADEYMVKPYSISQLRLAWEQAFERRRQFARQKREARARDEITDIIFHDVRNPLSVTRGYLSLMGVAPGTIGPGDIRAAAQGCDLAIDIIEQGEELGRIERSEIAVNKETFRLDETVSAAVESLRPLAGGMDKRIRTVSPADLPTVVADPRLVKKVTSDLVLGALKYASGKADVVVKLSASLDGTEALVAVTDDGLPVPREFKEAVFDKERQGELKRAACRRGRGLALPFAREACRRMGARIWVEDAKASASQAGTADAGCRFVVALHAAPMSDAKPKLETTPVAARGA